MRILNPPPGYYDSAGSTNNFNQEKIYFCPSCMYNSIRPGRCSACGSTLVINTRTTITETCGIHRRQE